MQLKHLTAVTSVLIAGAAAQNSSSGSNGGPTVMFNSSDLEMLNSTDSSSKTAISYTTRQSWCTGQRSACSKLCSANFNSNQCNATTLTWDCTCEKNNSAPGLQYYGSTMPSNICAALNGICMAAQAMNGQDAQANCNQTYVCSNLNITTYGDESGSGSGASQTGSSASASSTPSGTGSSSSSASSKGAAVALHVSEQYGAAMLGGTLFAALGLFL